MNESSKTILKLPFRIYKIKIHHRFISFANTTADLERNTNDVAQYPPIVDLIENTRERRWKKKCDWYEKIQRLPTVEQKLIEINMPKYFGFFSVMLSKYSLNSSSLNFLKFITRTQVYNNLPNHYYEKEKEFVEEAVSRIKGPVEDLITLHFEHKIVRDYIHFKKDDTWNKFGNQNFLIDLNNVFMKYLDDHIPHLPCTSVDLRPRIEGFWFVGGFKPARIIVKRMEGLKHVKQYANDPVDRAFRGSIEPTIALRTNHGLPDVIPFDGNFEEILESSQEVVRESSLEVVPITSELSENTVVEEPNDYSVESFKPLNCSPFDTDPKAWGLTCRRSPAVIVPGFWPGVKDEYGHIFFHSRETFRQRVHNFGESFSPGLLSQHAVVSGFTQALSYALYQGFTPGSEMTYPIVQQSVSSDGRMFQFGVYQLNTCRLQGHYSTDEKKINYLWLSEDMPLFESVEGGKVKGLNEDVLRQLCLMYLKKGQPRENTHPYLADYKYLMHHEAPDEYKEEFQNKLRRVLSERPIWKSELIPEILPWEYIYKVKFKTRPIDKKLKFFENRWQMNPYTRRLDDYNLKYIPKVRRLDFKINKEPRIHSELLFKHDWTTLKRLGSLLYDDDEYAFKTMNIDKDTAPYYNGVLWHRGMNKRKRT